MSTEGIFVQKHDSKNSEDSEPLYLPLGKL